MAATYDDLETLGADLRAAQMQRRRLLAHPEGPEWDAAVDALRRASAAIVAARAEISHEALADAGRFVILDDGRRLVMTEPPRLIGDGTTVECRVKLYDPDGNEIPIDPVRQITGPPLYHEGSIDPVGAIWSVLIQCVDEFPAAEGWVQ